MGMTISTIKSTALATSATGLITPSIDIRSFREVAFSVENSATAATVVHLSMEASMGPADSAANQPLTWFVPSTATFPMPSAVAATAIVSWNLANNPFPYVRIQARMTVSAVQGTLTVRVAGRSFGR